MQNLLTNQHKVGGTRGRNRPIWSRITVVLTALALLFSIPKPCFANAEPAPTVTIRVYNYVQAPPAILAAAEIEAGKILTSAGLHMLWMDCLSKQLTVELQEFCQPNWTADAPSIRMLPGHNTAQFRDAEFGYAAIPLYATVNYEHVARRARRDNTSGELSVILGCVIAHELGHLLLRQPGHSPTGIMQPQWGEAQIRQALTGRLRFTTEQSKAIQERAVALTALSQPLESR
jgi:hypothetical protein